MHSEGITRDRGNSSWCEVPIDSQAKKSRYKTVVRNVMMTICSGFFDCCLPIDLGDQASNGEAPNSDQPVKSQHDMYWDEKCETSPTAPGCKVYDN